MTATTPDARASAPAPDAPDRAAPAARRVLAQARFETLAVLRNGEQLLVTLVIPVVALVALGRSSFVELDTGGAARLDVVTPGVLGLAVMAGSLTSQAIATAFDRRNGVLRLLATTPLGRGGLLAGKVLAVLAVAALQVLVVGATALVLGWRPDPAGLAPAALALLLGVAAFTALALLLAGTLRAEAVLAVANLLLVVLAVVGVSCCPSPSCPTAGRRWPAGCRRAPSARRCARPWSTAASPRPRSRRWRSGRCCWPRPSGAGSAGTDAPERTSAPERTRTSPDRAYPPDRPVRRVRPCPHPLARRECSRCGLRALEPRICCTLDAPAPASDAGGLPHACTRGRASEAGGLGRTRTGSARRRGGTWAGRSGAAAGVSKDSRDAHPRVLPRP